MKYTKAILLCLVFGISQLHAQSEGDTLKTDTAAAYAFGEPSEEYVCFGKICRSYYPSGGIKSEGRFKKGAPHGKWKCYDEASNLVAIGRMKYGKRSGVWKFYKPDGTMEKVKY